VSKCVCREGRQCHSSTSLNLSAPQARHISPGILDHPDMHTQSVLLVLLYGEVEPTPQLTDSVCPVKELNRFMGHIPAPAQCTACVQSTSRDATTHTLCPCATPCPTEAGMHALGALPPVRRLMVPVVAPPAREGLMRGVCVVIINVVALIVPLEWQPLPCRAHVQGGRIGQAPPYCTSRLCMWSAWICAPVCVVVMACMEFVSNTPALLTDTATPPTTTTAAATIPITTGETSMPPEGGLAGSSSVSCEMVGRGGGVWRRGGVRTGKGGGAWTASPGSCVLELTGVGFARWGTVQLVSAMLPAVELDPRGQGVHEMLARALLYVSGGQGAHDALPAPVLYAPAGQGTHSCPSEPVKPDSQVQSSFARPASTELAFNGQFEQRAAPGVAYCPGRHRMHVAFPGPALNVPAWHGAHVPPLSPVKPGVHMHAACVALANAKLEFEGQFEHSAAPRAAYFPARHTAQEEAPVPALKVPVSYGVQAPQFAPV